jgi:hypothetical protein
VVEIAEASNASHGSGSRLLDKELNTRNNNRPSSSNYFDGNIDEDNDLFIDSDEDEEEMEYIPPEIDPEPEILATDMAALPEPIQETATPATSTNPVTENDAPLPPIVAEFTMIDGIKMKTTPFNKLAFVNLREKRKKRLAERVIVNTKI